MTLARASARTLCAVLVMALFVTLPIAAPADAAKTASAPAAPPAPPAPPSWDRPVNDLMRSPAVLLMTPEEIVAYTNASSLAQRAQIKDRFWRSATPNCPPGDNPVRTAFQAAVLEANDKFGDEGVPGWTTDRGSIYVLAGAPATTETKTAGGRQLLVWTWNAGSNLAQAVFVRDRLVWRYAGESVETATPTADRPVLLARLAGAYRGRGCQLSAEQKAEAQQVAWRKDLFEATEPLLKGGKAEIANPLEPVWYFFPAENDATFVMLTVPLDKPLAEGEKLVGLVRSVDDPETSAFSFGTEDVPFEVRSTPLGPLAQAVRTLQPGHYVQALARLSATGEATLLFAGDRVIPTLRRDSLTLTSVILARELKALGKDEGKAPFRLYGFEIVPNPDALYHPGDAMTLFFVAMGAEDPATKKTDLKVGYHIYFSDPRKGWIDTKAQAVSPKQEASVQARDLTLPAAWPIGDYKVVIEVTDNRSGATVKKEIGFGLRKKG